MKDIFVDFESNYSSKEGISVSSQGNYNYIRDSNAYIVSLVDPEGSFQWCGEIDKVADLDIPCDEDVQPWAVNSNFDQAWWDLYYGHFKKPWMCLLDLLRYHQCAGDLARGSRAVIGEKVIDKKARDEMDGVRYEDLPPEGKEGMKTYCLTDGIIAAKVKKLLSDMTPFEQSLALHTRMINRRGVAINVPLVESDIAKLEHIKHEAFLRIPWTSRFKPQSKKSTKEPVLWPPKSMLALRLWCKEAKIPEPKSRAKDSEEIDDLMTDHPALRAVIEDIREFEKASILLEKARAVLNRTSDEGIMPPELIYCGAYHTRRWTSRGVNIQNLHQFPVPFGAEEIAELEAAKKQWGDQCWRHFTGGVWSRRWFVPRKGKKFIILDFSQIEPRCLAWLIDDQAFLAGIRAGLNPYESHARATMGWTGGVLKKENPNMYKLAKIRCLSAETLILTRRGYIPINKVTIDDELWDGAEWVNHDGVIQSGVAETIDRSGERFTPEHRLFTGEGRTVEAGAVSKGVFAAHLFRRDSSLQGWGEVRALGVAVLRCYSQAGTACGSICLRALRRVWRNA